MNRNALHSLKVALIGSLALPLSTLAAQAAINLKQVQVTNGSQIDLLFDGKVTKAQIETDFFNDIIQVVLKDTTVYPAKISSVSGGNITKVFAYQYAPKLVRCRFSVKGKAEDYKNLISIAPNGKMLTIRFNGSGLSTSDQVQSYSAAPLRELAPQESVHTTGATAVFSAPTKAKVAAVNEDESALLEKVMKNPSSVEASKTSEDLPLTGHPKLATGKPLPSPLSAFAKLGFVLAIFGALAIAAKKILNKNTSAASIISNLTASLGLGKGKRRKKGKMIEVITTHFLGPKKSLAIIRVGGKNMLIGITGESINLISQLSSDADMGEEMIDALNDAETMGEVQNSIAASASQQKISPPASDPYPNAKFKMPIDAILEKSGPAVFSDILKGHAKTVAEQNYGRTAAATSQNTARSQIKSRLEGLKPL